MCREATGGAKAFSYQGRKAVGMKLTIDNTKTSNAVVRIIRWKTVYQRIGADEVENL